MIGLFGGPGGRVPSSVNSKVENRGLDSVEMSLKPEVFLFPLTLLSYEGCRCRRCRRRRGSLVGDVGHRMRWGAGKG